MKALKTILILVIIFIGFSNGTSAKNKKITVTVMDQKTEKPVLFAQVTVITVQDGKEIETISDNTDSKGRCKFSIPINDSFQYIIRAEKTGYHPCTAKNGNNDKVSELTLPSLADKEIVLYITSVIPLQAPSVKNEPEPTPQVIDSTTVKQANPVAKIKNTNNTKVAKTEQKVPEKKENEFSTPVIQDKEVDVPLENPPDLNKNGTEYTWLWILIIVVGIFLWITFSRYNKKCEKCGKWNAMKTVRKETVSKVQSTIKKVEKTKDSQGRVIQTKERNVPATKYTFHIHRKCKHCGHTDYLVRSEKREN